LSVTELDHKCEAVRSSLPGGQCVRVSNRSGRAVFSVTPDDNLDQRIEEISRRNDVEYAERDVIDSRS